MTNLQPSEVKTAFEKAVSELLTALQENGISDLENNQWVAEVISVSSSFRYREVCLNHFLDSWDVIMAIHAMSADNWLNLVEAWKESRG